MRERLFFPVVLFLATIGFVATDLYLPSLPAIRNGLGSTEGLVQLTITLYLASFSLSQVVYGPLSDAYGRRPLALIGLAIGTAGALVALFAPNVPTIIVGRIVQGLGMGATACLWRAVLRDSYSGHDLAAHASFIAVGTAILMALAPTAGGYIETYLGWRANFLVIVVYTFSGLCSVWLWLPETHAHKDPMHSRPRQAVRRYEILLRSPVFLGYSGGGALALAGLMAYLTASPFLLQVRAGLSPVTYGWTAVVVAAGVAVGGALNRLFVRRAGPDSMLHMGLWLMLLSGLAITLLGIGWLDALVIVTPVFFYALGAGMTFANGLSLALTPFPRLAGAAGALYGTFQIGWSTLTSGIMAALPDTNQRPLGIVITLCALIALAGRYWARSMGASTPGPRLPP